MNRRYQIRFGARTPSEIRKEAFVSETPVNYRIPENNRIENKVWNTTEIIEILC